MKSSRKEVKEALNLMIRDLIEEGSRGRIQWETVRSELIKDLDIKRAAYLSAVAEFRASYEEDLQRVIGTLRGLEEAIDKQSGVVHSLEAAREVTPPDTEADPHLSENQKTEIYVINTEITELKKRRAALLEYKPAGSSELFDHVFDAENAWREAKAAADKVSAGICAKIRKQIRELEKEEREAARGIWSSVEIPVDCRLSELRRNNRGSLTVSELILKRKAAEEEQRSIDEAVMKTREAISVTVEKAKAIQELSEDREEKESQNS